MSFVKSPRKVRLLLYSIHSENYYFCGIMFMFSSSDSLKTNDFSAFYDHFQCVKKII